ncbi:hypothetical protein Poli38472_010734 [Pythium oligandrum]|uniref:histone deacetylase n=1 Tax=Pythium oligandrum TaxID=41045 RepID=A0A8K1CE00_PYTOL|nr:hypothetical protein Poli38472_010734 [Pythium oligandrum]|eukprot:TMW61671.1 hypothetical protein Poli38472_010734 [Pythium oligandrum]
MGSPELATTPQRLRAGLTIAAQRGFLTDREWTALRVVCREWRDVIDAVVLARRTLIITHATCERHRIPRRSERPERLRYILDRVSARFPQLQCVDEFPTATAKQLARFHTDVHVDAMHRLAAKIERSMAALDALEAPESAVSPRGSRVMSTTGTNGRVIDKTPCTPSSVHYRNRPDQPKSRATYYAQFEYIDLDEDTVMMRHTLDAALTAAGGVCHAIDRVMKHEDSSRAIRNAFCVVRPPGHHAEPQRAMGFCFFNNIGVGAFHALDQYGLDRVAILDFDVHHGNGTQRRVEQEPRLFYASLHQSPLFPHTGQAHEHGEHNNILNIPLPARTPASVYRQKFLDIVWPRVLEFGPQLILVSAGFDGHALDPLSDMRLQAEDFYWLTREIVAMAWQCSQGRVVSVLEGGYHARALADSAEQHLLALVHGSLPPLTSRTQAR